jgi:hypothetical protein
MRPERPVNWLTWPMILPPAWSTSPKRKMSHPQPPLQNASPFSQERHAPPSEPSVPTIPLGRPLEPFPASVEREPAVIAARTDRWLMLDRLMGCED